jgi:hypothetical protein
MPDDREAPDAYEVIIAFGLRDGEEGAIKWVQFRGKERVYEPGGRLAELPLEDIDLLDVGNCDIMVCRSRKDGIMFYCPNRGCIRWC